MISDTSTPCSLSAFLILLTVAAVPFFTCSNSCFSMCSHNGLDVGEDGKTHQCIDYIGVMRNLFGYKTIVPADPNQTDRVTRYVAKTPGNFLVVMGRSSIPILLTEEGAPLFGTSYEFRYGHTDLVRNGKDAAILTTGGMVYKAIQAWQKLREKGVAVQVINISCAPARAEAFQSRCRALSVGSMSRML